MPIYDNDGHELAPCIVCKAKYALRISLRIPLNTRKCSQEYWNKVVTRLLKDYSVPSSVESYVRNNMGVFIPVLQNSYLV